LHIPSIWFKSCRDGECDLKKQVQKTHGIETALLRLPSTYAVACKQSFTIGMRIQNRVPEKKISHAKEERRSILLSIAVYSYMGI
jgi:hypothetical protein